MLQDFLKNVFFIQKIKILKYFLYKKNMNFFMQGNIFKDFI